MTWGDAYGGPGHMGVSVIAVLDGQPLPESGAFLYRVPAGLAMLSRRQSGECDRGWVHPVADPRAVAEREGSAVLPAVIASR